MTHYAPPCCGEPANGTMLRKLVDKQCPPTFSRVETPTAEVTLENEWLFPLLNQ